MRRPRPGLRGRLLLSVLAGIGLVLAALTLAFNLVLDARLNSDANGLLQARASGELASLRVSGDRILLPEAPDEGNPEIQVWVFAAGGALEEPRTGPVLQSAAAALARRAPAADDVAHTRLQSVPVVQSGRRLGAVVAGVSLTPYEQLRRTALIASGVLALAVLLAVAASAGWLISRALHPVARMTRQASEWSEYAIDRRFSLGPPHDELTQLAATLDGLLERLAASLRHEQRLSAELSHELRTPLANIAAEAQYALRHTEQTQEGRATLEQILASADRMKRTLDTLIAAARAQLDPRGARSDAAAGAHAARAGWLGAAGERGIELVVAAPRDPLHVRVEQDLVERILAPLIENAMRYANQRVQIDIQGNGESVSFTVQDDGPGVPAEQQEAIFQPGHRTGARAATLSPAGAGLGLALSRRLARTAGGDVQAQDSAAGGRFTVRLPAAR
jgi:two-component system, OmpR family, sensor kinase